MCTDKILFRVFCVVILSWEPCRVWNGETAITHIGDISTFEISIEISPGLVRVLLGPLSSLGTLH